MGAKQSHWGANPVGSQVRCDDGEGTLWSPPKKRHSFPKHKLSTYEGCRSVSWWWCAAEQSCRHCGSQHSQSYFSNFICQTSNMLCPSDIPANLLLYILLCLSCLSTSISKPDSTNAFDIVTLFFSPLFFDHTSDLRLFSGCSDALCHLLSRLSVSLDWCDEWCMYGIYCSQEILPFCQAGSCCAQEPAHEQQTDQQTDLIWSKLRCAPRFLFYK